MEHPEIRDNWEEITDGSNLIFGMDMDYAQDDTEVKLAWDSHNSGESKDVQGICLVTGERAEIARIHRGIKGVPLLLQDSTFQKISILPWPSYFFPEPI